MLSNARVTAFKRNIFVFSVGSYVVVLQNRVYHTPHDTHTHTHTEVMMRPRTNQVALLVMFAIRYPNERMRLLSQVMDLEARLEQAQQDLKSGVRPGKDRSGPGDRALPRAPAKVSLSGHRNPITCVALHPLYSVVASASEDATVKVRRRDYCFFHIFISVLLLLLLLCGLGAKQ